VGELVKMGWTFMNDSVFNNINREGLWAQSRSMGRFIWRILFFPVFSPRRYRHIERRPPSEEDASYDPVRRGWFYRHQALCLNAVFGLAMRLLSTPLVLLFSIAVMVYASMHADPKPVIMTPDVMGLYYETVHFNSLDGTSLEGWYIPSLEADDVLAEGDKALRRQRPGVVLCHEIGANRSQLLGLASVLHHQGFEVMLFDFRCCGDSGGDYRTFGLREREDVLAAVHCLQGKPRVRDDRVAIVGQGIGAVAALGAAGLDHSIRAVVAADIDRNLQTAVTRKLGETPLPQQLCSAAFTWGCKMYFRVNDSDLSAVHQASLLGKDQSILLIYRPRNEYLAQSAMDIVAGTSSRVMTLSVDTITPCVLTEVQGITTAVADFLRKTLEDDPGNS
jgi:alpha-beta hydrolase superfamily lysophospholipase